MKEKIEMRGYATRTTHKNGETDDGKQDYRFSRNQHLLGEFERNGIKKYISVHTDNFEIPYCVKEENQNRRSHEDPFYVTMCTIVALTPILDQAGEPRRDKGFDLFEAVIEF